MRKSYTSSDNTPKAATQAMPFQLHSFGLSDLGLVRKNNEDAWGEISEDHFYVLADGMGGHNAGEIAAYETVKELCQWRRELSQSEMSPKSPKEAAAWTETVLREVNSHVYEMGLKNKAYSGMGTTVCTLFFCERSLVVGHVGDSRIYRYRNQELTQITKDHSLLNDLIQRGRLSEDQAETFGYKNVVTKAIGVDPQVEPSVHIYEVLPEDLYFMCSDGLSDSIPKEDIAAICKRSNTLTSCVEGLIEGAKKAGGHDNITVVVVYVE